MRASGRRTCRVRSDVGPIAPQISVRIDESVRFAGADAEPAAVVVDLLARGRVGVRRARDVLRLQARKLADVVVRGIARGRTSRALTGRQFRSRAVRLPGAGSGRRR